MSYLFCNVIDQRITVFTITSGKISRMRLVNMISILFKTYPGFVKFILKRFHQLACKYYKLKNIEDFACRFTNSNSFWSQTIYNFKCNKVVIFDGNQKGSTRKKLYILGMIFGFRHTIKDQKLIERRSRNQKLYYSENLITKELYNMKELKKLKICWDDSWIITNKKDIEGNILYKLDEKVSLYKRGIMLNSPGIITFTKI